LIPWGWLYGVVNAVRVLLYRYGWRNSYRCSVPVVSVGNIAVGGTGKTPLVDYILRQQAQYGRHVAVVSRGYGGEKGAPVRVVCAGEGPVLSAGQCGDEPFLLASRNPESVIIVAPRRADGIRFAIENFAVDLILLDDGYQHLAVQRDLNVLLLDSRYPFGNGYVLPAGLLREFPSALQRADMVIMTRYSGQSLPVQCQNKERLFASQELEGNAYSLTGETYPLSRLQQSRCVAFAGIATPDDFFTGLKSLGITLQATLSLSDHCTYSAATLQQIRALSADADILLTTEKDAVKLSDQLFDVPCCTVGLTFQLRDSDRLAKRIDDLFL